MKRLRRLMDWPFSPGMFPDLLKLPKGEPRRIAVAKLQRRAFWWDTPLVVEVCIRVSVLVFCAIVLVGLALASLGSEPPWVHAVVLLVASLGSVFVMLQLPALLQIRSLRRELARMIAEGDLWKCAKCSHPLKDGKADRCPECGEPVPGKI